ncbi:MAG: accessory gene regulator B family protein [Clostridia bacterium]|nr:accessory gene regulator B family protein [Clostridia bacterium]
MRFIHVWSYSCANYLMYQLKENHERRRVYYYGFQIVFGAIVKAVLLLTIAVLVKSLVPTLIILFIFGSLRVLAGGFHMDTYGRCIVTSTVLFVAAGMATQYSYRMWDSSIVAVLIAATTIFGAITILKWAPKDNPNKPITKPEEIRKFKGLSFMHIIVWALICSVLLFYRNSSGLVYLNMIIISSSFGILLELFTVAPVGYGFFEWISGQKK